eukprot:4759488-Pyramimonas_sp.AAC.1
MPEAFRKITLGKSAGSSSPPGEPLPATCRHSRADTRTNGLGRHSLPIQMRRQRASNTNADVKTSSL